MQAPVAVVLEDDLADVTPLEGGVPIEHVYRSSRLLELQEELDDNLAAFLAWADESLALYDAAREQLAKRELVDDQRIAVLEAWQNAERLNANQLTQRRRAALRPLVEAGMTLRGMSVYLNLPLTDIVMYALNQGARRWAEEYAAAEEYLMTHGVDYSLGTAAKRFGVTAKGLKTLCDRHGIAYEKRTSRRLKWPIPLAQRVLDLRLEGKKPAAIAEAINAEFPDVEGFTKRDVYWIRLDRPPASVNPSPTAETVAA